MRLGIGTIVSTAGLSVVGLYQAWVLSLTEADHRDAMAFVHVVNPFKAKNCTHPFCPFDQEGSLALESMQRAKAKSKQASVVLAAATFPEDKDAVPRDFVRLPPFSRSVASEYPDLVKDPDTGASLVKKLPFIQDIFDRVLNIQNIGEEFDYLVYTNSDIILHENFYNTIQEQIENEGYDVFTINRQTIPSLFMVDNEVTTLDDIYAIDSDNLQRHPGTDCYVIKRTVLEKIQMGDIFLGSVFFGSTLNIQLNHFAARMKRFFSFNLKATYHLGDDRAWKKEGQLPYSHLNGMHAICVLDGGKWSKYCEKRQWETKQCLVQKRNIKGFLGNDFDFMNAAAWCERNLSNLAKGQ